MRVCVCVRACVHLCGYVNTYTHNTAEVYGSHTLGAASQAPFSSIFVKWKNRREESSALVQVTGSAAVIRKLVICLLHSSDTAGSDSPGEKLFQTHILGSCTPATMEKERRESLLDVVRRSSSIGAKKKFSIIEFTAQQRALAEKVLGKWHGVVEDAHAKLREGTAMLVVAEMLEVVCQDHVVLCV